MNLFASSILIAIVFETVAAFVAEPAELNLSATPAPVQRGTGQFVLDGNFDVQLAGHSEPRLIDARDRFLDRLTAETGMPLNHAKAAPKVEFVITTDGPSQAVQQLGEDESYHLQVTSSG